MTKEITLQKEISPLVAQAQKLTITNDKTLSTAVEMLSLVNKKLDAVIEEKEKVTKPLNEALKAERGRWKPIETICEEVISLIRSKLTAYQTLQVLIRREAEEKIANRIGKGKLKLETAVAKINSLDKPQEKISTASGLIKFKTIKKFRITDINKIPRTYLVVDESLIREAMKNNTAIAGVEYFEEQTPINFR